MDTDGSRQIRSSILMSIIKFLLAVNSVFCILNLYIIANNYIMTLIQEELFKEGYFINNVKKCIYKIEPILYGERT